MKENLDGWLFTYNSKTDKWRAARRDHATELFSNYNSKLVISSSSIKTLEEIIMKTNGDPTLIKNL